MSTPIRVLIVEDTPADAELILGVLADHGFAPQAERVETEAAYLAGLDAALDVILADYRLPHFSGPRALELLNERRLDIPFIVVSGAISDVEAANLIKSGASDFLLKDRLARLGPAVTQALKLKHVRDEQRRLEATLAESEEKFRLICETATDVVVLLDEDNRIRYANPAIGHVFGYTPGDVEGKHIAILQPTRLRELHQHGVKRFLETGVATRSWGLIERFGLHRDGHEFPVEIAYSQMITGGRPVFVGVIRDITERKRAEDEIRTLNADLERRVAERTQQLEEANRAKTDFLANTSHELRTPLNSIIGFSEMLKDGVLGELDAKQRGFVADIFGAGTHLLALINDILDLSKVEAGALQLEPVEMDVAALLEGRNE